MHAYAEIVLPHGTLSIFWEFAHLFKGNEAAGLFQGVVLLACPRQRAMHARKRGSRAPERDSTPATLSYLWNVANMSA